MAAVLAAAHSAVNALTAISPWRCSDGDLELLVVQTESLSRRVAGAQLAVIAEGLTRGLPAAAGAGSGSGAPGRWVRSLVAATPGDASRRASLATSLFTGPEGQEFTPTREALLAGQLGVAHATQVVEAVGRLGPPATPAGLIDETTRSEAQVLLVSAATGGDDRAALDPTQVARAGVALTATLDPGAGDRLAKDEDRQHQLRSLTLAREGTGMWWAQGHLSAEVGQRLFDVVGSLSAPRPGADGSPDPRTAAMRSHDGLGQALTLLQSGDGVLPGAHRSPNRLVVSVTAQTLAGHLGLSPRGRDTSGAAQSPVVDLPHLPGRWPISPLSAQVMSCDSDLVAVLVGPDGSPLDVGDTVYPFSARARTAIIDRDQHCTYGACTAPPSWCHVHHLQPYSRGGPTAVTNGALLCGAHHRFVHAHQLTGQLAQGQVTWRATAGTANPQHPPAAVELAINALATRWHHRQSLRRRDTG